MDDLAIIRKHLGGGATDEQATAWAVKTVAAVLHTQDSPPDAEGWHSRRWTDAEIERLMQCKVLSASERNRRCRHGGELSPMQEFALLTARPYKSCLTKYHKVKREREASRNSA